MRFREYNPDKDKKAAVRIWREVGWVEKKEHEEAMAAVLKSGRTMVAEVNGEAECMVNTSPGTVSYQGKDLDASFITGVTTSRVVRKQGLASRLFVHTLDLAAADGAKIALLSIFDQGYYNQLGFGNGSYEHWCTFDPADLDIDVRPRVPARIAVKDWERVHQARLARLRRHGACSLTPPEMTQAEMLWSENGFGLGYYDGPAGELTHHFWCSTKAVENGPYTILWMAYQTKDDLLELLALVKNLGDQVHSVKLREPSGIQLQDLLTQPFKARRITSKSQHENRMTASAYWQARILDLPGSLEQTRLPGETVRFNLVLTDPIERFCGDKVTWRGIAGNYVVTLGRSSGAEPGRDECLPTLNASVNAFTRLWLGVRPATSLAWTDDLSGSPDLLERLDTVFRLPVPQVDWDF
jgi:predicted N-acetyltransferase YhbS